MIICIRLVLKHLYMCSRHSVLPHRRRSGDELMARLKALVHALQDEFPQAPYRRQSSRSSSKRASPKSAKSTSLVPSRDPYDIKHAKTLMLGVSIFSNIIMICFTIGICIWLYVLANWNGNLILWLIILIIIIEPNSFLGQGTESSESPEGCEQAEEEPLTDDEVVSVWAAIVGIDVA